MSVKEALWARRSIRGYRPDRVPGEVIKAILDIATRAPSALNSQPWEFAVVTGQPLEAIRKHNDRMLASGVPAHPDFPARPLEGVYRQRQVEVYAQLSRLMGFNPADKEAGARWRRHSFRFFEAPAVVIIYADAGLDTARTQFDLGLVSQSVCLAALEYGLGTCICLQGVSYPEKIREVTAIPDAKQIAIAIALGYPDRDFPANRLQSRREPVERITRWCGFDESG